MLVALPHGTCVDPETVKFVTIRVDRPQPGKPMVFTVAMKVDADDHHVLLASFDDRSEAESLANACAEKLEKLVALPHGTAVDPDVVKVITIRVDRPQGMGKPVVFTVAMRTDADDNWLLLGSFEDRAEAEALVEACAEKINKGADASDDDDDDTDADDGSDDDEDEAPPKAAATAADIDDDW